MKLKITRFCLGLLLLFNSGVFSQDQADPEVIKQIRDHYYGMTNNPANYRIQTYGQTQVWFYGEDIHRIITEQDGNRIEACFEGSAAQLNFVYIKGNGKEDRYYFDHYEEGSFFPFMERWKEGSGTFHGPREELYFQQNLEIASMAIGLFNEIEAELKYESNPDYEKFIQYSRKIDRYVTEVEEKNLRVQKTENTEEGPANEGGGVWGDVLEKWVDENGEVLIEKESSFSDAGGMVSQASEGKTYYQEGKMVFSLVKQEKQYYATSFFKYSSKSFKKVLLTRTYYSEGRKIFEISTDHVNGLPTYMSVRRER